MPQPTPPASRIIQFPYHRARSPLFANLDQFVLDELTPVIGFTRGSAALDDAGIQFIGQLVRTSESELAAIPGIGPRKLARISEYLAQHGLAIASPSPGWEEHHGRRLTIAERSSHGPDGSWPVLALK